jgi:outer membrane protein assembly factor BamB
LIRTTRTLQRAGMLVALLLAAIVLASCTGNRVEATWGSLSVVGNPATLIFAFYDRIVMLDPITGQPLQLVDNDGNTRLDDQGNPRIWEVPDAGQRNPQVQFYTAPVQLDNDTLLFTSYASRAYEVDMTTGRVDNGSGTPIGGQSVGNPLLVDNTLYLGYSQSNLQALDLSNNTFPPTWTLTTEHGIYGEPILLDGTIYTASLDHNMYALDAATGDVQWKTDMNGAVTSAPALSANSDALYVGSFGNALYKVNLDGQIVSSVPTSNWVWGTPAVSGDMVYFGDVSGNLYAAQDTGDALQLVWGPVPVATNSIVARPLVTDSAIIVGSRDKNVYWVDPANGSVLQTRQTKGEVLGNMLLLEPSDSLSISEPIVVVSTMAHEELVIAFSLDTGERLWAYQR